MPALVRLPVHLLLAAAAALALAVGCGGDDEGTDGPASVVPANSLIFIEGTLRPDGQLKEDVNSLAATIGGVDDLGDLIVTELEEDARESGEPFDFESEVEPWLGERAGFAWRDGDQDTPTIAVESTDTEATQDFVDKMARRSKEGYRDGSYDGVAYKVGGEDDEVIGLIGDFLVSAEDERAFKAAVDAAEGESLADLARYEDAISAASDASLADAYIDVGGLIEASEDGLDEEARQALDSLGIDPSDATAVASVIPSADRIEVELSGDLAGQEPPEGDASELLGSMPADSFVAVALAGFGEQVREAIDKVDKEGIPGEVPPGQLKQALGQTGIDLDALAKSLGDAAAYATGGSERALGGALVIKTDDPGQASKAISTLGTLARASGSTGVTAIGGGATGFSIRDPDDLGDKPVVVAAKGDRIAIGYGAPQTLRALRGSGATLAGTPEFEEASDALGDAPLSGFVDGPATLRLVDSLMRTEDAEDRAEYRQARKYLRKIDTIAIGSERDGDLAVARLVISLEG